MPTSILEQICAELESTLATIRLGSSDHINLEVERKKETGHLLRHGLAVLDDTLEPEPVLAPLRHAQWRQPFALHIYARKSESDPSNVGILLNNVAADTLQTLKADITRGGLAINTVPGPFRRDKDEDFPKILISFDVIYRTLIGNPFSQ